MQARKWSAWSSALALFALGLTGLACSAREEVSAAETASASTTASRRTLRCTAGAVTIEQSGSSADVSVAYPEKKTLKQASLTKSRGKLVYRGEAGTVELRTDGRTASVLLDDALVMEGCDFMTTATNDVIVTCDPFGDVLAWASRGGYEVWAHHPATKLLKSASYRKTDAEEAFEGQPGPDGKPNEVKIVPEGGPYYEVYIDGQFAMRSCAVARDGNATSSSSSGGASQAADAGATAR